jgi:hypothetical protein
MCIFDIMGYLEHIFSSGEKKANQADKDDEKIIAAWSAYENTIPEKVKIINALKDSEEKTVLLDRLIQLLKQDLIDISNIERFDADIVSCMQFLKHYDKIEHIRLLEDRLSYTKLKYQFTFELFLHIFSALQIEDRIAKKFRLSPFIWDYHEFFNTFEPQLSIEKAAIEKIGDMTDFHTFLVRLAKGEHKIHLMDSDEKNLIRLLKNKMTKIFNQEITEGLICDWALKLYNAAEDIIQQNVAEMQGGNVDFEFVNRPEFYKLARRVMEDTRKKPVSQKMLNVLVYLFREWYNHERGEVHV